MRSWARSAGVALLTTALLAAAARAQDKFFDSNGVPIRYVEQGSGEAIVLLHGGGASLDGWLNSGMLQNLAKDYHVIAFDARGHGKSGKPHDVSAYGPEMGRDVIRLLDHLGIRRAHIVGYSMGAFTTAQLLTVHPERFLSATLGGAPGWFRWTDAETADAEQEASEKERECVSRTQIFRGTPANEAKPDEAEIKRRSAACMADPSQDRFAQAALVRARKDNTITPAQVAEVKVPTLGIVGSLDNYLADFQELKRLRPDVKLVVLEGATHNGTRGALRRPEFIANVREFIASQRTSSTKIQRPGETRQAEGSVPDDGTHDQLLPEVGTVFYPRWLPRCPSRESRLSPRPPPDAPRNDTAARGNRRTCPLGPRL